MDWIHLFEVATVIVCPDKEHGDWQNRRGAAVKSTLVPCRVENITKRTRVFKNACVAGTRGKKESRDTLRSMTLCLVWLNLQGASCMAESHQVVVTTVGEMVNWSWVLCGMKTVLVLLDVATLGVAPWRGLWFLGRKYRLGWTGFRGYIGS